MLDDPHERELPPVSVLFITYNRAHTLVATYESFVHRVNYPRDRLELILCDDASDSWHCSILDKMDFDKVIRPDRNRGLGANHNAGIAAASGTYLLSLQDDCMLIGDGDFLRRTVACMDADPAIALVGYRERPELPVLEKWNGIGETMAIYGTASNPRGCGDFAYSDQPHVKRRDFHERVGMYREKLSMAKMELEFQRRVAAYPGIKVAALVGPDPFVHIGAPFSLNKAMAGASRRERLYRVPFLGPAYRRLRGGARYLTDAFERRNRTSLG